MNESVRKLGDALKYTYSCSQCTIIETSSQDRLAKQVLLDYCSTARVVAIQLAPIIASYGLHDVIESNIIKMVGKLLDCDRSSAYKVLHHYRIDIRDIDREKDICWDTVQEAREYGALEYTEIMRNEFIARCFNVSSNYIDGVLKLKTNSLAKKEQLC